MPCPGLFQWLWPIVIRPTLWQRLLLCSGRPTRILLITSIGTRRWVLHLVALSLVTCLHPARADWDLTGDWQEIRVDPSSNSRHPRPCTTTAIRFLWPPPKQPLPVEALVRLQTMALELEAITIPALKLKLAAQHL